MHDMGEYWDEMPEAHFGVDLKKERIASLLTPI